MRIAKKYKTKKIQQELLRIAAKMVKLMGSKRKDPKLKVEHEPSEELLQYLKKYHLRRNFKIVNLEKDFGFKIENFTQNGAYKATHIRMNMTEPLPSCQTGINGECMELSHAKVIKVEFLKTLCTRPDNIEDEASFISILVFLLIFFSLQLIILILKQVKFFKKENQVLNNKKR